MAGLLKTGLKTALIEALYNEVVSNTNNYYYFIGRPVEWDTEDPEYLPAPETTLAYENAIRNEMVLLKKITPGDIAYTVKRYDWSSGTVFDKYDDQLGKQVVISGCVGGQGVDHLVITTVPWSSGLAVQIGTVVEYENRVYKVVDGIDGEDSGIAINLGGVPPTHTSGTQENGEAFLRFTGYDQFDPSIIEIGMLVSGTGVATGARVVQIEGDTVTVDIPNSGPVNGDVTFTVVSASGASSLAESKYYCLTSDFNVYKCLDNNNGGPSTVKPFSTTHEVIRLADGYAWKFMYTIPRYLINKFLTPTELPITTALKNQYYSRGSIAQVIIADSGTGYGFDTQLDVVGDGHLDGNVYKIMGCDVDVPGEGYSATPLITVSDPYEDAEFAPAVEYFAGQYVKVSASNKMYQVVAPGTSGNIAPDHTRSDPIYNGSASFKFVGYTPTATPVMVDGAVQSVDLGGIVGFINITSAGYGYTTTPAVTITAVDAGYGATATTELTFSPLLTNASIWQKNGVVAVNDIIRQSDRLYKVTAGTDGVDLGTDLNLGDTPPTHTSGTVTSGEVSLEFIGRVTSTAVGRVTNVVLTERGQDYFETPLVGIEPPAVDSIAIEWEANLAVEVGDVIKYREGGGPYKYYSVIYIQEESDSELGGSPPVHTVGFEPNGDVDLEYIAEQAVATAEVYRGFGYLRVPTVSIQSPVEAGIPLWAAETYVDGGDIIRYNNIIYQVDGTDENILLGYSAPTHSVGTDINGSASLTVISRIIKWIEPVNEVTEEVNGGDYVEYEGFYYQVDGTDTGLLLGTTPPYHRSGTEPNGAADLTYIGQTAVLSIPTEKTKAKVVPIVDITSADGQINGVVIVDGGVGYTAAAIRVSSESGTNAELIVDTSYGNLDTKQANIELLAVPGSIDTIQLINPGAGYASAQVAVEGDGQGCVATAELADDGSIAKIVVSDPGIGYTRATVTITGTGINVTPAYARAIVSPSAGHGRNAVRELSARNLTIATSIATEKNQGFQVNEDYTQVGILKNPQQYSSTLFAKSGVASTCFSVNTSFDFESVNIDDVVYEQVSGARYRVLAKLSDMNTMIIPEDNPAVPLWPLLLQSLDNVTPISGQTMVKEGFPAITGTIARVTLPTIDKYSGDMLFTDNLAPFKPSDQQSIALKTTIKL